MTDFLKLGGWVHNPHAVGKILETLSHPIFAAACGPIKSSGEGKTLVLSDCVIKLIGKFNVRTQAIGDCVSFGAACAVDMVKAAEIIANGNGDWIAETSTEDIYGGSRVNVGNGEMGSEDGSYGAWAAKYVRDFGTLVRIKYDMYDLTNYSGSRAQNWGMPGNGVPSKLLPLAKEHQIKTVSLVKTYEECRDAIANGYAVTVASNQGFSDTRDSEGFASPEGAWGHQMCIIGVDDSKHRPGVLIQNSWGNWNSGPTRLNQPVGSFWVDADVVEERMLSMGDSWAFSDYTGFPIKTINLRII